ncbi:hypothetical protein RBH29_13020 [Herbivorax sp. ANBcel31]|uniref:NAD(P)/FAD-dependent oxidoreductase n=1 Tax=Herbivorax sp. ANBcel31 TaxID=3069754 RepID=UPI0027B5CFAC|nr:hypothetical protein [Herbivorax sp. ANBcel31]MDQ2087348.1 hypothetical protein [Herbivorax sp. ANBcel31]
MKIIVHNLKMSLDYTMDDLKKAVCKKIRISEKYFNSFRIVKESVDARKKPNIHIVFSVVVEIEKEIKLPSSNDIRVLKDIPSKPIIYGDKKLNERPIVVGSGPAGLFASLILAQNGYKPLLLERGESVEKRTQIVNSFWTDGKLDKESNVQFGEGGAGTFSDGKLTTRINDRRSGIVLDEFYKSGAPEKILFKAKPHIGSDILKEVVLNMRKRIIEFGGEVRFNSKITEFLIKDNRVSGVKVNHCEKISSQLVVLAVGHSARDTFKSLFNSGVKFIQKPFSIGVRIEHPQQLINMARYGEASKHPRLGAADYQMFKKFSDRTVYSFCMCPGGVVVASASEPETIVTNGMSEFSRDKQNANSALVVSVGPDDFESSHPLAGIEFQRKWERLAFKCGGGNYSAPIQKLGDFLNDRETRKLGGVKPSYTGETVFSDINLCLPSYVTASLKKSIDFFDSKIKGFGIEDAILTGVETRTSSPVRIVRDDKLEAVGINGLYPAGEGAGYAGGIVSAAVDGIKIAEEIIKTYSNKSLD